MFRRIINRIIIFFSLIFGFGTLKTKDNYQEPQATSTISKDQDQAELEYLLSDECSIAYDPKSPEAIAEMSALNSSFDKSFKECGLDIPTGYFEYKDRPILSKEAKKQNLLF